MERMSSNRRRMSEYGSSFPAKIQCANNIRAEYAHACKIGDPLDNRYTKKK